MKSCVLITGMHRSGTSYISSVISGFDYALGYESEYADEENPNGYYENFDVVAINDEILKKENKTWFSVEQIKTPSFDDSIYSEIKEKAELLLTQFFDSSDKVVLKDPRFSLTMGFWLPIFKKLEITLKIVVMVRDPEEVAISQSNRKKHNPLFFNYGDNHLLSKLVWKCYYQSVFSQLKSMEMHLAIIDYNFIHTKHEELSDFIKNFLGIDPTATLKNDLFDPKLYRSRKNNNALRDDFYFLYQTMSLIIDGASIVSKKISVTFNDLFSRPITFDYASVLPALDELLTENFKTENRKNNEVITELSTLKNLLEESRKARFELDNAVSEMEEKFLNITVENEKLKANLKVSNDLAQERFEYMQKLSAALTETQNLAYARLDEIEQLQKQIEMRSSSSNSESN